jgi:hypothetical protein
MIGRLALSFFGVEAEFHQVYSTTGHQSFQRTYEMGVR